MDHASGDEDKGTRSATDYLFSHLNIDLSLQNIEFLLLGFVDMLGRSIT